MYCDKCGARLNEDSSFCPNCGTKRLTEQPRQAEAVMQAVNAGKYDIHSYEPLWNFWYIKELIGAGSYGKVYLAHREEYGQTYYSAVKHIAIPQDEAQLSDLYAEGLAEDEASAQEYYKEILSNILKEVKTNYELKGQPNIVLYEEHAVFARPEARGYDVFIKMELLTSLSKFLKNQRLSELEAARLGIDICSALEILNKKKILHRDIKPANIFVTDEGVYKLGDFGIARHMEKTVSSMSLKGTYAYMPPEIQKGDKVDNRADIYSLGLVLYRILNANRAPFLPLPPARISYADNNLALERRMSGEPLPQPRDAGAEMSDIILKACSYRKEERWQDAAELKQALQKCLQSSCSEQKLSAVEITDENNIKDNINSNSKQSAVICAVQNDASDQTDQSHTLIKNAEQPADISGEDTVIMLETDNLTQTIGLYEQINNGDAVKAQLDKAQELIKEDQISAKNSSVAKNDNNSKNKQTAGTIGNFQQNKLGKKKILAAAIVLLVMLLVGAAYMGVFSPGMLDAAAAAQYAQYISAGNEHAVVLQEDGSVQATGANDYGQCNVEDWDNIIAISAGNCHTVGLKKDGTVVATGNNSDGQCNVQEWQDIIAVSAGNYHTVGIKKDGSVMAIGWNIHGQCDIEEWQEIIAVSAGGYHTVGVKKDGSVVATGWNNLGQCNVKEWTDIIDVATGSYHTVGLKENGSVVAVGSNEYRQLDIDSWCNIVAVSSGFYHTVGLKANGEMIAVGNNTYGQSNKIWRTNITAIAAGGYNTIGLLTNGKVINKGDCDYTAKGIAYK